jgi:K+-transporting ATPase ATPase A chain
MSTTTAGIVFIVSLVLALAVSYRPLGDFMARTYQSKHHLRVESWIYRATGIDPDADQKWGSYLRSMLAFSLVSVLCLYAILRLQGHLPYSLGFGSMPRSQAWNTAASFTTNTNWQSYSGESALGYTAQMAGLAVQNFVSAAVGIAIAVALVRGFVRSRTDQLGNFWVDLVRTCVRILLPISVLAAVAFIAGGAIENFHALQTVHTIAGNKQAITGGPVASQEAIKQLGTNGGGF